jgi:hypothetical protein
MLFTGICSLQTSYATNISETVEKVMNADDTLDKNDNLKSTVYGLGRGAVDLIVIIVTVFIMIRGPFLALAIAGAGENPQKKAVVRTQVVFVVLGILFLGSYFKMFTFLTTNISLFN